MVVIVTIITLLFVIFYTPIILQTEILVKNIVTENPRQNGDILFNEDKIEIKGFWNIKKFDLDDLKLIIGYIEITHGLEEVYCLDFIFSKGPKILFDISKPNQSQLIDQICDRLFVERIKWENPIIFTNDNGKEFQTIYEK